MRGFVQLINASTTAVRNTYRHQDLTALERATEQSCTLTAWRAQSVTCMVNSPGPDVRPVRFLSIEGHFDLGGATLPERVLAQGLIRRLCAVVDTAPAHCERWCPTSRFSSALRYPESRFWPVPPRLRVGSLVRTPYMIAAVIADTSARLPQYDQQPLVPSLRVSLPAAARQDMRQAAAPASSAKSRGEGRFGGAEVVKGVVAGFVG